MRGFVFSLDAAIAVIITILFLLAINYTAPLGETSAFSESYLSKRANDVLVVLNKNYTLETLNQNLIQNSLQDIVPSNFNAYLKLSVYNYTQGSFALNQTIEASKPSGVRVVGNKDVGYARRLFNTFYSGRINNNVLAELWMWSG